MDNDKKQETAYAWFADAYIGEIATQESTCKCWITLEQLLNYKTAEGDIDRIVFVRRKLALDSCGLLLGLSRDSECLDSRLYSTLCHFDVNGILDVATLVNLKQFHAKLRVGLKDCKQVITRIDVI